MRRWKAGILMGVLGALLCLLFSPGPVSTASRTLTEAILQGRAWVYTAVQTMKAGGDFLFDGAIADPTVPQTVAQGLTTGGSCRNDRAYRFYYTWKNASGETLKSVASTPDFTPAAGTTNRVDVTRPTPPTNAVTWHAFWSQDTDGHADVNACGSIGQITDLAVGTTTNDCRCVAGTAAPPTSNTTAAIYGGRFGFNQSTGGSWFFRPNLAVKEVCPQGCEFTTVASALTAITDASATKPYTILVRSPFQGTETVTAKSYVSIVGDSRMVKAFNTLNIPAAVTDVHISNLTAGAQIQTTGNGSPGYIYIDNIVCGTPTSTNIDCIHMPSDNWRFYVSNSILQGVWDVETVGSNSTLYAYGNTSIINDTNGSPPKCWNTGVGGSDGTELYDYGSTCDITISGIDPGLDVAGLWVTYPSGPGSRGNKVHIVSPVIRIRNDSTSPVNVSCLWIGEATTNSATSSVTMSGADCTILGTNTQGAHYGVKVDADADHANWRVLWEGGRISLAGGASRADVNNAETVGGFYLTLKDVEHSGTYIGAGTVRVDAPLTDGRHRLTPLATAPATCAIGDRYSDTSGADCFCAAANSWEKTNATGSCV